MIKKVSRLLVSIYYNIRYRCQYKKRIKMCLVNSIKGPLHMELLDKSSVFIGEFLMSRGPMYLKGIKNGQIVIGNNCFFNHNCSITAACSIKIGNDCMFANNIVIIDHDHKVVNNIVTDELLCDSVIIDNNVWIGANTTILKGVHIGEGAIVAAGAVVNKDVEAHSVVGGVPIRILKDFKNERQ